jgi:chitinase
MMKFIRLYFLLIVLAACGKSKAVSQPEGPKKAVDKGFYIVGYMFSSGDLDVESAKLDLDKITHLNVAFINPDEAGVFAEVQGLKQAVKRAHDKGVKVFSSFAGGVPPQHLKELLKPDKRAGLVASLVNLTATYNLDGIDVDLEGDFIDSNYEAFVTELHTALKRNNKQMTAAVATWNGNAISDKALALFDLVHIMSYDQTGPWNLNNPGPHSTYEAAIADLNYWNITRSVPFSKLTLGVPFYGYGFGPDIPQDMSFDAIVRTYPGAESKDQVEVPGKGTVYYNGIPTIKKKTALALEKKAAGIMIWQLFGDAKGDKSLLGTINNMIP